MKNREIFEIFILNFKEEYKSARSKSAIKKLFIRIRKERKKNPNYIKEYPKFYFKDSMLEYYLNGTFERWEQMTPEEIDQELFEEEYREYKETGFAVIDSDDFKLFLKERNLQTRTLEEYLFAQKEYLKEYFMDDEDDESYNDDENDFDEDKYNDLMDDYEDQYE